MKKFSLILVLSLLLFTSFVSAAENIKIYEGWNFIDRGIIEGRLESGAEDVPAYGTCYDVFDNGADPYSAAATTALIDHVGYEHRSFSSFEYFTYKLDESADTCVDDMTLKEYYCSMEDGLRFGRRKEVCYTCPFGCTQGNNGGYCIDGRNDKSILTGWDCDGMTTIILDSEKPEANVATGAITYAYVWYPLGQRWVQIFPSIDDWKEVEREVKRTSWFHNGHLDNVMAFYSEEEGELYHGVETISGDPKENLETGWNFISIRSNMIGKKFSDIVGTCDILAAWVFSGQSQEWVDYWVNPEPVLNYDDLYQGLFVYVSKECSLDF